MIGGRRRPDDIFIGFPPDVESVAGDGEAIAGETVETGRSPSSRNQTGDVPGWRSRASA